MNKGIPLVFVLVLLTSSGAFLNQPVKASANSWATVAPMNVARSVLGVAVVSGKIYAIGGSTANGFAPSIPPSAAYGDINLGGFVGTNEEYDPVSNTWTYKASMPTPRMAFAIAAYDNKIYCMGGRNVAGDPNGGYTSVNEVYDPTKNTWETKAPMPNASGWLVANEVQDKIYVLDYSGKNYVYDPAANSWSTRAPAPASAFDGYASAVLGDKIYVVGGLSQNGDSNSLMIYNTGTDVWSYGAPPPSSQGGGAAGATTGAMAPKRIYVFGEAANLKQGEESGFVRVYNPENDSWEYGADSPTSRYNFAVATLNDSFYVIGGHTYSFSGNFAPAAVNEQYTPIGYGTVVSSSPSPLPTPSPSSSSSSSTTLQPTLEPTVEPSQSATPTTPQNSSPLPSSPIILVVAALILAVIIIWLAAYLLNLSKKKKALQG